MSTWYISETVWRSSKTASQPNVHHFSFGVSRARSVSHCLSLWCVDEKSRALSKRWLIFFFLNCVSVGRLFVPIHSLISAMASKWSSVWSLVLQHNTTTFDSKAKNNTLKYEYSQRSELEVKRIPPSTFCFWRFFFIPSFSRDKFLTKKQLTQKPYDNVTLDLHWILATEISFKI